MQKVHLKKFIVHLRHLELTKASNCEDFSYSYWGDGEPNNDGGIEHYRVLYKVDKEWGWNDGPIDTIHFTIQAILDSYVNGMIKYYD